MKRTHTLLLSGGAKIPASKNEVIQDAVSMLESINRLGDSLESNKRAARIERIILNLRSLIPEKH